MREIELYDRRFDWLVASLLALPPIWLCYGIDAAFVSALMFLLIGALKPIYHRLGSKLAAGIFAAGLILLISPLLRHAFYNGYCFEAPWAVAAGLNAYISPQLCGRGLWTHLGQDIWVGPLRDLGMPVAGLGLMLIAQAEAWRPASETEEDNGRSNRGRKSGLALLVMALCLCAATAYFNHRAAEARAEAERQAEIARKAAEAETAAKEEKRIAAEKAAKQVARKWLIGAWVPVDGLSAKVRKDRSLYCATDTGIDFKANGDYHWYDESGRFQLEGAEIKLGSRSRSEYGDADSVSVDLEPSTLKVERDGAELIIDGSRYARC